MACETVLRENLAACTRILSMQGLLGLFGHVSTYQPETAREQIVVGVVQGLGYALMEEIPVDSESGAPQALNLQDFKIPTLADIPIIEPVLIERPDPVGPCCAKALGELPLVPVGAAITNAVYDTTGVRIRDLPISAEKVLLGLTKEGNV